MAGEGHQKLTIEAQAKGTEKTAADIGKVADAQKKVAGGTKETADASRKATASTSDYTEVLRQINPMLGNLVDGLVKGSKIAGDMASQNISLSGAFSSVTGAVKKNAKALALIGAGGAVVLGIGAITSALARMRKESEEVTQAIRAQVDALNELAKTRAERQAETERQSAKRAEGPMAFAESAQADVALERLAKSVGFTDEEARRKAVLLAGPEASQQLLERLAILLDRFTQIDIDKLLAQPLERRLVAIDRLLARREKEIATAQTTEATKREEMIREAVRETQAQGGSTAAIEQFISSLPGALATGADPALLAQTVAGLPGIEGEKGVPVVHMPWMAVKTMVDAILGYGDEHIALEAKGLRLKGEGVKGATPELVRSAEFVSTQLEKAVERMERAAVALEEAAKKPYVQDYRNAKFIGPDAASRARATRNGETLARQRSER